MKLLLATSMIAAMALFCVFIVKSGREKNKPELAGIVRKVLVFGLIIVLSNFISLISSNKTVVMICYSVYFSIADWMLYCLFKFSTHFMGKGAEFEKMIKSKPMYVLLGLDSISIIANVFLEHMFTVQETTLFGNELYFNLETKMLFYIHYAIVLFLAVLSSVNMYYRAFKSPVFYRRKYLLIAIVLTILMILNALMMKSAIDLSVLGYIVEGICIYYCALVYTPQRLVSKTLVQVSQEISLGLYVLDIEGNELFCNNTAEEFIKGDSQPVDSDGVTFAEWCHDQYSENPSDFVKTKTFKRGEEELILKIQLQRLTDVRERHLGGYFIITDTTDDYRKMLRERYVATHDSLTGLYNKEFFCSKCRQYINENPDSELILICTDIKDFKMINDFFGTAFGDKVLTTFAAIIKSNMKDSLVFGRLGNDNFGILMQKDKFNEQQFTDAAQKVFACIGNPQAAFQMINYIGVYTIHDRSLTVAGMCDRARMAINKIKGDYHKRVSYYDDTLRDNIMYEQELIADLDKAIRENQFKMYLQPQMSSEGRLLGGEALVRWMHPVKGQIMPGDFIPVFEKNGLISDVDRYIWETACKQLRKWKEEGRDDLYISVNISPRDFYFLNIYQVFTDLIEKYEIDPKYLKLEITETAVVMDFNRQLDLISRLRKTGFTVEMDDFGSGYSSLNMLKDIHVDVLKIDMAFLKKAEDEDRSRKILQMIISLSRQLGMPVITEGVENAEQVRFLTEMGCDMFQGYYFAKPMSVADFEELYAENRKKFA